MARTESMPLSIQSDVPLTAVGEALLQHYNVGIKNPWFEEGHSDQETYNRRQLPWAGNSYTVDTDDGTVSGPNPEELDSNLTDQWIELAKAAEDNLKGERYEDLDAMYKTGLQEMKSDLSKDEAFQDVEVTNADGETVTEERYLRPAERE